MTTKLLTGALLLGALTLTACSDDGGAIAEELRKAQACTDYQQDQMERMRDLQKKELAETISEAEKAELADIYEDVNYRGRHGGECPDEAESATKTASMASDDDAAS